MKTILSVFFGFFISISSSQTLLKPDRIFDGNQIQEGWVVLVEDNKITAVGPESNIIIPENSEEIILKNKTYPLMVTLAPTTKPSTSWYTEWSTKSLSNNEVPLR